ncbi:hypothetical protein CSC2_08570 [Clostridium zeae]|uniref:Uncharacterized protein n=1 Tax=Clostridium zeae TaxID=2759022 RepID=A0ABQ1E6D1_9CLOT|nr:AMP-binding protein [Clostridium zeae]GFZ30331.1 hypothetical protein CSC2_08570 [Clostridium zeae]
MSRNLLKNINVEDCRSKNKKDVIKFELIDKIRFYNNKMIEESKLSTFALQISIVIILLKKYTSNEDLILGLVKTDTYENLNQEESDVFFIRNDMSIESQFLKLFEDVKNTIESIYNNNVKNGIRNEQLNEKSYLSDMLIGSNIINSGIDISEFDNNLILLFDEENDKVNVTIGYNTDLYSKEYIYGLYKHMQNILNCIIKNPEINIIDIQILDEEEKKKILYEFNNTKIQYDMKKTTKNLLEEQVERTPNNIAVVFEDKKLTYRELNEKANRLARTLREKGVKAGTIVGIMIERSLEMLVGVLAVVKSGGAYLPIDSEYPKDRIDYILSDSKASILLTQKSLKDKVDYVEKTLFLDDDNVYSNEISNLNDISVADDLAYIIYTSGTTGKPKGVMLTHKGLNNLKITFRDYMKVNKEDKIIQFASFSFDGATRC